MLSSFSLGLALATLGQVALGFQPIQGAEKAWRNARLNTLVTFGDSFTDEGRLGYFIGHDGEAPPVGWVGPRVGGPFPCSACTQAILLIS
jgi:hypothetical protein